MKVLVLGGKQAFGPGLACGQSFVGQLARRLRAEGGSVQIDQYGPLTLNEANTLLSGLRLHQYEVILLQFGEAELSALFRAQRLSWWGRLLAWGAWLLRGDHTTPWRQLRHQLATVLMLVQPHRRHTLLLSPLPQRSPAPKRVQRMARRLFLDEARLWAVPGVDVGTLLGTDTEFFQPGSATDLSALAHELLGSELHTLISERDQAEPSLPTVSGWRRLFYS